MSRPPHRRWCRGHPLCEAEATRQCAYCPKWICKDCVALYVGAALLDVCCFDCRDRMAEEDDELVVPEDEYAPQLSAPDHDLEAFDDGAGASWEPRERVMMHREEQLRGKTEIMRPACLNDTRGPERPTPSRPSSRAPSPPPDFGGDWALAGQVLRPEDDIPL